MAEKRGGFSLLELLVVVIITGVSSAVLLPALSDGREQDRAANCAANLKQIGRAIEMYKLENDSLYPGNSIGPGAHEGVPWTTSTNPDYGTWTWAEAIWSRLSPGEEIPEPRNAPAVYHCPADRGPMQYGIPMSYNMNSHRAGDDAKSGWRTYSDGIGRSPGGDHYPQADTYHTHDSWVQDPGYTLLLMEAHTPYYSWRYHTRVRDPRAFFHEDIAGSAGSGYVSPQGPKHGDKYNWLFCDGSVRAYTLYETIGEMEQGRRGDRLHEADRPRGMWTKTRGDAGPLDN